MLSHQYTGEVVALAINYCPTYYNTHVFSYNHVLSMYTRDLSMYMFEEFKGFKRLRGWTNFDIQFFYSNCSLISNVVGMSCKVARKSCLIFLKNTVGFTTHTQELQCTLLYLDDVFYSAGSYQRNIKKMFLFIQSLKSLQSCSVLYLIAV